MYLFAMHVAAMPYVKVNVEGCCLVIYHLLIGPEKYLISDLVEIIRQIGR